MRGLPAPYSFYYLIAGRTLLFGSFYRPKIFKIGTLKVTMIVLVHQCETAWF